MACATTQEETAQPSHALCFCLRVYLRAGGPDCGLDVVGPSWVVYAW